jgi:hypothetical protein
MYQKRLEQGTYEMPEGTSMHHSITAAQLNFLLSGVNLKKLSYRPRYQHTINNASIV